MDFREPSALIITLPMDLVGGVQSKARFLAAHLNEYGYHVTIASYVGRSSTKDLNVGWVMSFFGKKGRIELCESENDIQHIFVGSRFPGTEFTYTENSASWRRVLGYHNKIIAVGGTPLIAYPAASLGKKFILWCADDLTGDRRARMITMSRSRRFIDKAWILPKLIQQQSVVLNSGMPLRGVSSYTVKRLHSHVRGLKADIGHLPIPIESEFFLPVPERKQPGTMGFAGRISDKRKNAVLLFEAFRELRLRGVVHELHIAGPLDDFSSKGTHTSSVHPG